MASKSTEDSTREDFRREGGVEDQSNTAAPARERLQLRPLPLRRPHSHGALGSTHLSAHVGSFSPRLLQLTCVDWSPEPRATLRVEEVCPKSDIIFTPFVIARPAEEDPNLARRKHFIYRDSLPGPNRVRRPGESAVPGLRSILRRHNISPRLPKPHKRPKTARFTNLTAIYRGQTPVNESDIIWTALRPPGEVPDSDDVEMKGESPIPSKTENDKNSASFHHLMMSGPTAASYSGTQPHPERPKMPPSSLRGEASPSTAETSEPSRFDMLAPRPPTPPLPSPPPIKPFKTFILPPDDVPIQGSSTSTRRSAPPNIQQPSTLYPDEMLGEDVMTQAPYPSSETPGSFASPNATDPPLRIGPTQYKGRGLFATRSLPTGTIIVRERPLIEERHDLLPGGQRRIRGS